MKKKRDFCLYCKSDLNATTTRKKFCSTKCRVYFAREIIEASKKVEPNIEVLAKVSVAKNKKEVKGILEDIKDGKNVQQYEPPTYPQKHSEPRWNYFLQQLALGNLKVRSGKLLKYDRIEGAFKESGMKDGKYYSGAYFYSTEEILKYNSD